MTAGTTTPPSPALTRFAFRPRLSAGWIGGLLLLVIALPCFLTLPWSLTEYERIRDLEDASRIVRPPSFAEPMGTDELQRSLMWRVLMGGAISLGIGLAAAGIAVTIGVTYGATAALLGGRYDAFMMRVVDVLYGLPYILLVVLIDIALQPAFERVAGFLLSERAARPVADITTLLVAIGGVSWLTMSRVIRGQVLSLRDQPFVEAARASGSSTFRILRVHLLPNLVGPIVVYTTLTVPQAILQESFLSFLGIGVQAPMPSWGNLASDGLPELHKLGGVSSRVNWWLIVFPCLMLGLTLLALNFLGDALRDHLDPKSKRARA